jgi:hypothetical protein
MKRRIDTPEERERVERILDATLRDPEWVAKAENDCRPGIRGYCGRSDCEKCNAARERAQNREPE